MNITDARQLADKLIDHTFTVNGKEYCARDLGYSFKWMNRKRGLGLCKYRTRQILLSEIYVRNNDVSLVEDTIRHELAHVFSHHIYGRIGCGHNRYWKHVCVQVGANPKRCKTEGENGLVSAPAKYLLRHTETKVVYGKYYRFPTSTHRNCQKGLIWIRGKKRETEGKLEVVKNTTSVAV